MLKKIFTFITLVIVLILLISVFFISPVSKSNPSKIAITIEKGEGVTRIAEKLKQASLIKSVIFFKILVKISGQASNLKAGDYLISPSDSLFNILSELNSGRSQDVKVTIIEGVRREEIAEIFRNVFGDQFKKEFLGLTLQSEGRLFPDTYLIKKDASPNEVFQLLTNNFENKYSQSEKIKTTKLSKNETINLASLVEREAKLDSDRPIIAGIIYKRYLNDWPLEVDATVQYILGYIPEERSWWKKSLSFDELAIESPFNTRKNTGFPPHPICNPGLSSLMAASNPILTDYWFYLSDSKGTTHYAKTLEEHQVNVEKYL